MSERTPRISVITVCRNSVETIEDTLRSVASQTSPSVEHIVVDGGSRDGTMRIVERFPHVAKAVSEPDRGIYDAMNKGIRMATGDIIGTINADDFYAAPDVLARVASAFEDPTIDACYGDLCYVGYRDTTRIIRYWRSSEFTPDLYLYGWCPPHPTFFVRRSVYDRQGTFDLSYKIAADVELTMRYLVKHRLRARYLPHVLVKMRVGGTTNNSISNIVKQNLEIWRALKAHGQKPSIVRFVAGKVVSRLKQFATNPA
jgi:glycosyltransferase involved in cell wall biosynthesis